MDRELVTRRRTLEGVRAQYESDPDHAPVSVELRDSWRRCAPVLPVALDAAPYTADEVDDRWDASPIRRAVPDLVAQLEALAVDGDMVAAVTDATGQILWTGSGRTMARLAERVHFVPGGRWDERSAGTNAPGLALLTGEASTVFAVEHWCEAVHDWVCYAAPVRRPDGTPVGVVDLSTTWKRHTPLALATVSAMARLIETQLPAVLAPAVDAPLAIDLLGPPHVSLGGARVPLPLRQLEILAVLATLGEVGFEALHAHLYGDRPVSATTLKAEVSHLRRALAGGISSRPYRLELPHRADFLEVLDLVSAGRSGAAVRRYRGQLLTPSEAPFVIDQRHHLDVVLRAALLRDGTAADLLAFSDVHPWDIEVLERARERAGATDPLAADATDRLTRADG